MHNQPYVGRVALCTRKKLLKSGEIRHFYGIEHLILDGRSISPFPYSFINIIMKSDPDLAVTVTLAQLLNEFIFIYVAD